MNSTESKPSQSTERALTPRAIVLGATGSAILTASSLYIALKMGALPWPIVFAALASVLALRAFGSTNLHEANVTHAAMSAGSMVAGGLAFTIPGLWMIGGDAQVTLPQVLVTALGGTILGLVACAALQPYFIRKRRLAYPIGLSAAETLKATSADGGSNGHVLFLGMGFSALWAVLRDVLAILPQRLFATTAITNVAFGMMDSPMMLAMGFIVGVIPAGVWFLGALIGNFAIAWGLPTLGILDATTADAVRTSLGLGLMLGVGAGVILVNLIPSLAKALSGSRGSKDVQEDEVDDVERARRISAPAGAIALVSAAVACVAALALGLGVVASCVLVVGAWFCVYLSAWLTGTTGVNPMEIFGVMVLLLIQLLFHGMALESLFLAAALTAVACGICGDVMNDLKAGDCLATDPKDQFIGMAVGGLVGAVVASLLLMSLYATYGAGAFGPKGTFVAAQASVVATMAGGIPNVPAFVAGIVVGCVLACLKLPVMTLGLGVYLPFYISSGAAVGALVRFVFDRRHAVDGADAKADGDARSQALAAGILGGESLVGVIVALVAFAGMLAG